MGWVAGHLTGGLGNRLFQHAAAAGLAERWGRKLVFYEPAIGSQEHGPTENVYKLYPQIERVSKEEPTIQIKEEASDVYRYRSFPDEPFTLENCLVDGFRQTWKYFPSLPLRPAFESIVSKERQDELLQSLDKKTWFVHMRFGDYKSLPHHQMDIGAYYINALKSVPKDANLLIFSDDELTLGDSILTFFRSFGYSARLAFVSDEIEALFTMSRCSSGIVANSTFSWWGAYFGRLHNGTSFQAIYPDKWGVGLPDAVDIIPRWGTKASW